MYQGFNLKIIHDYSLEQILSNYLSSNKLQNITKIIVNDIKKYVINQEIDAKKIEDDWFPEVKADVFISHSHKDEKLAMFLADWLNEYFGISSFIDSCVWGYANELLKQIDNKYCVLNKSENGHITYNYDKRNTSTAHVHTILCMALQKMIDKTECLFFLNTPNSLKLDNISQEGITNSCWIYNEILFSSIVRRREPSRYLSKKTAAFSESVETFKYTLDLNHLIDINEDDLCEWMKKSSYTDGAKNLDILYEMIKAKRIL